MIKSEVISWPVTLAILLLAFGSLVAAGLPLMLTVLGLVAAAGMLFLGAQAVRHLDLGDELRADVRPGAGHRLRPLHRRALPPGSLRRRLEPVDAVAQAMETAGKAVVFSGMTVLISLSAVLLVPSPAFRSMAVGIMFAVIFVLAAVADAAARRARQARDRVNRLSPPWLHRESQRSPRLARWAERSGAARSSSALVGTGRRRRAGLAGRATRHRHAVDHRGAVGRPLAPGL